MKFIFTLHFKKAYKRLSGDIRENFQKKLLLLAKDINHPSLRVKKLKGNEVWAGSITMNYRFTFFKTKDAYIFINIGTHDII